MTHLIFLFLVNSKIRLITSSVLMIFKKIYLNITQDLCINILLQKTVIAYKRNYFIRKEKIIYCSKYHNSGYYPTSCLLFKT
jgi:hypothetical protein